MRLLPNWAVASLSIVVMSVNLALLLHALHETDIEFLFGEYETSHQLQRLPRLARSSRANLSAESHMTFFPPPSSSSDDSQQQSSTLASKDQNVSVLNTPDLVVVAGAWRRPNGTLARAFENRVKEGMAAALLLGVPNVLFTGALNDGYDSLAFAEQIPVDRVTESSVVMQYIDTLSEQHPWSLSKSALLKELQSHEAGTTLGQLFRMEEGSSRRWPLLHAENVSRTTQENGEQTGIVLHALLQQQQSERPPDAMCPSSVLSTIVLVTSPYHTRRAKKLFVKEVQRAVGHTIQVRCEGGEPKAVRLEVQVLVLPSIESEAENLLPPVHAWVEMDVLSPRLERMTYLPLRFRLFVHSLYMTYRNWVSHTRATLMSHSAVSSFRELGAFCVALNRGHLKFWDLFTEL